MFCKSHLEMMIVCNAIESDSCRKHVTVHVVPTVVASLSTQVAVTQRKWCDHEAAKGPSVQSITNVIRNALNYIDSATPFGSDTLQLKSNK